MRLVSLVAVLTVVACARRASNPDPAPSGVRTETEIVAIPLESMSGMLQPRQIAALGDRLVGIRVDPDSLVFGVGDTIPFSAFRVLALDSAGTVLGRIGIFDHGIEPGAADIGPGGFRLVGMRPGGGALEVAFPRFYWRDRPGSPPRARLKLVVVEVPQPDK